MMPVVFGFLRGKPGAVVLLAVLALMAVACAGPSGQATPVPDTLRVASPAFAEGQAIPVRFTCDGDDVSPPLEWSGVPAGAESLALVMEDPDAPGGVFSHWVVWNIPADAGGLPQGVPRTGRLGDGTRQGVNDFRRVGYGGPCPPPGETHRYRFRLFALDTRLDLPGEADRDDLLRAVEGHTLARGELQGTYGR